jgi:nucleotide-binding universal stress UspA family protein
MTGMFETILIPTDGSEAGRLVVDQGLGIARRYGATVHALSVLDDSELPRGFDGIESERRLDERANEATAAVADRGERLGVSVQTASREGNPVEEILAYAEACDADLIVVGSHDRGRLAWFLHRSVAEKVAQAASAPVLTVRASAREPEAEYRDVLLATDGREGSRRATRDAVAIAREYGATLHALYVVDDRLGRTSALRSMLEAEGERAKRDVRTAAARASVDVVTELVEGTPQEAIVEYVDDHEIDLLVLGTEGRTGLDRLFVGSVARDVLRASPVPVLTVRTGVERDA